MVKFKEINNGAQIIYMEIKDMSIEKNKKNCGGATKTKSVVSPTKVKTPTRVTMDGALRLKPTLPKRPAQNSGAKK